MATAPANHQQAAPSADERTRALLAHVLAIVSGFLAPLIFYLVKKDSCFALFHALQVLLRPAAYLVDGRNAGHVHCDDFRLASSRHPGPNVAPPFAVFGMGGWVGSMILGMV